MANSGRRHSRFPAVSRAVPAEDPQVELPVDDPDEPEVAVEAAPVEEPEVEVEVPDGEPYPSPDELSARNVADIVAWVGDDEQRATYAVAAEGLRDTPRKGVLALLSD